MKKILSYGMLLMLACFTFFSCSKSSNEPSELAGTSWFGSGLGMVTVTFSDEECHINPKGMGKIIGTYETSAPNVYVTITSLEDQIADELAVGDKIEGEYDLEAGKMTVEVNLSEGPVTLTLSKIK